MNRRQALKRLVGAGVIGAGAAAAAAAERPEAPGAELRRLEDELDQATRELLDREMHTRMAGLHMAHFDIAQGRSIKPDGETDCRAVMQRIRQLFPGCNEAGSADCKAAWDYRLEYAGRDYRRGGGA